DRVEVARAVGGGEASSPAVVVHEAHRGLAPVRLVGAPILEEGAEHLVAFLEDVGGDLQRHPDLALDGIAPAVHQGRDVLDDDRAAEVLGVEHGLDSDRLISSVPRDTISVARTLRRRHPAAPGWPPRWPWRWPARRRRCGRGRAASATAA